jgi:hypothetical protein
MHRLIRFVIKAETVAEAKAKVIDELNQLVEWGKVDYGTLPWDSGSRWPHYNKIYSLASKEGREVVLNGLLFDYETCLEALREVKELIAKKSDFEIATSQSFMDKYTFERVNKAEFVLFENNFIDLAMFQMLMSDFDINKLWVICADVHT